MTTATDNTSPPIASMLSDIKIAHSIFAMPFAILAAVMAAWPPVASGIAAVSSGVFVGAIVLIVAAMVTARTAAMLSNRILDRTLDARNPRTASRPLASGAVAVSNYVFVLVAMAVLFVGIASLFWFIFNNPWPLMLSLPVLVWVCAYGLFKRFTAWCHVWLGASLALSVPAAAVAINPGAVLAEPSLWLLAGMVLCWVAGFDVIYALQDVSIDRQEGLHSMPSRLGVRAALWVSRILHLAAVTLLILVWWFDPRFGWVFLGGIASVAILLIVEHATVQRWGTTRIAMTFFTLNGVVSCVLGVVGSVDVLT
jgi:4-hydroxybenzoate polyprenyltransferase